MRSPGDMPDPATPALIEIEGVRVTRSVDREALVLDAFTEFHGELYGFLRRSTRSESAAEDLVQETFIRLMTEVEAGRTPVQVRAWLFRVASNLAISRGRRASTVVNWLRQHGPDAARRVGDSPEAAFLAQEQSSALESALSTLRVSERVALLMSADGFSGPEIATAVGRSHAATRTMLSRARVKVRLQLESSGDGR